MNSIWSKIKRNAQYQQEEVQDWAFHLEHLQCILVKFDIRCALTEKILCRYFYKGLKSLIRLWIDEESWKLDSWNALVKKKTKAKAKAKMQAFVSHNIN